MSNDSQRIQVLRHDGDPMLLSAKLRHAIADVIVIADAALFPNIDEGLLRSIPEIFSAEPGLGMVAGVVTDPGTGVPWAMSLGLAFTGHPLPAEPVGPDVVPTMVPGRLWAVRREALNAVGGLNRFATMDFASIDLAWRLWAAGNTVRLDPTITVPGPAPSPPPPSPSAELDALALISLNLSDHRRRLAVPAALDLLPARLAASGLTDQVAEVVRLHVERADGLDTEHAERQLLRRRPDVEIVGLMGDPLAPDTTDPDFLPVHARVLGEHPGLSAFGGRWRIAVVTADALGTELAGPAIRAFRIARELAATHEVRLVSVTRAELDPEDFEVSLVQEDQCEQIVSWCDILILQGPVLTGHPLLEASDAVVVVDMYDPLHLEQLEQGRDQGELRRRHAVHYATALLNEQFLRGDFFLYASHKQRILWLGALAALGRVNPATYDEDQTLGSMLGLVPFGVSDEPPVRTTRAIKGVFPGISEDDQVVIWGGGVYNWFDPLTLIRAIGTLKERLPSVRLVFLGMRHPSSGVPETAIATACRRLADELDLVGTHVFFNEGWVPFDERQNYLLDADVAVTTHFHHVETEFSFRTRVLDYLWAGLPTITTNGDALSELVDVRELGIAVPPQDVAALDDALFRLLTDQELAERCRRNIAEVTEAMRWSNALRPLVEFCASPRRAPDLMEGLADPTVGPPLLRSRFGPNVLTLGERLRRDVAITRRHLNAGGPQLVIARALTRFRAVLRSRRWI